MVLFFVDSLFIVALTVCRGFVFGPCCYSIVSVLSSFTIPSLDSRIEPKFSDCQVNMTRKYLFA